MTDDAAIHQRALQCAGNIQGPLVLAKSGLSEAEIREMRDAMIAAALMSRATPTPTDASSFRSRHV